jgi:Tfp pilus assembly protein PilX
MCTTRPIRSESLRSIFIEAPPVRNDNGSSLVVALVILLSVAIIGMIALQLSTSEIRIAASDRNYKESFYAADGSMELASELLEQNIESITGDMFEEKIPEPIQIGEKKDFWTNPMSEATTPSEANWDFFLTGDGAITRTNVKLGGQPETTRGAAIQMAAGYEGRGKSAAQGGSHLLYRINAQSVGRNNSEAIVRIEWRHVN